MHNMLTFEENPSCLPLFYRMCLPGVFSFNTGTWNLKNILEENTDSMNEEKNIQIKPY